MESPPSTELQPGLAGQAKALLGTCAWWAATALLGVFALHEGFANRTFGGFVTAALAAALCAPPLQRGIRERTGLAISPGRFKLFAIVALGASLVFMAGGKFAVEDAAFREEQFVKDAAYRDAQAELQQHFVENKAQVVSNVKQLLAASRPVDALAEIEKYAKAVSDPALAQLRVEADVAAMKLELRNEYSLSLTRREEIYVKLIAAEPVNVATYGPKLVEARAELAAQRRVQAASAAAAAKKAAIEAQFSAWDGSHPKVEAALKARMHNPDSYKHVETRYSIGPDTLTVMTTYRGTNGFGAVVTNRAVAKADLQGNVLSISSL